eukprot:gene11828-biopygen7888
MAFPPYSPPAGARQRRTEQKPPRTGVFTCHSTFRCFSVCGGPGFPLAGKGFSCRPAGTALALWCPQAEPGYERLAQPGAAVASRCCGAQGSSSNTVAPPTPITARWVMWYGR